MPATWVARGRAGRPVLVLILLASLLLPAAASPSAAQEEPSPGPTREGRPEPTDGVETLPPDFLLGYLGAWQHAQMAHALRATQARAAYAAAQMQSWLAFLQAAQLAQAQALAPSSARPAPPPSPPTNNRQAILATLVPDGTGPCATLVGTECRVLGDLAGSTGTVVGGKQWRIVVPAGRIPSGAIATVFIPTTGGIEAFDCPPALVGQATVCTGRTAGHGRHGGTIRVHAGNLQVAQGTIVGADRPPGATPITTLLVLTTGISLQNVTTPFNPYQRTVETFSNSNQTGILDVLQCSTALTGTTPLRSCGNGQIAWIPYSYAGVSNGQVNAFTDTQTRQHLALSSAAMSQVVSLGQSLAPGARVVLVGHSLGGAVAAYWGASQPSVPVITLDSPVAGAWPSSTTVLDTYCARSVNMFQLFQFSELVCFFLPTLPAFNSDALNDLRLPSTVALLAQANMINFGNQADFIVPAWYALHPQARRGNVLIAQPCTYQGDPVGTNHFCILLNSSVSNQVAAIVTSGTYPSLSVIRPTINLNIVVTQDGQPVNGAAVTAQQAGQVVGSGSTNAQGMLTLTVPWYDTFVQAVSPGIFRLQCTFGALPANNADLSLNMVIGCSP